MPRGAAQLPFGDFAPNTCSRDRTLRRELPLVRTEPQLKRLVAVAESVAFSHLRSVNRWRSRGTFRSAMAVVWGWQLRSTRHAARVAERRRREIGARHDRR